VAVLWVLDGNNLIVDTVAMLRLVTGNTVALTKYQLWFRRRYLVRSQ
jgi:hypothetical protein